MECRVFSTAFPEGFSPTGLTHSKKRHNFEAASTCQNGLNTEARRSTKTPHLPRARSSALSSNSKQSFCISSNSRSKSGLSFAPDPILSAISNKSRATPNASSLRPRLRISGSYAEKRDRRSLRWSPESSSCGPPKPIAVCGGLSGGCRLPPGAGRGIGNSSTCRAS